VTGHVDECELDVAQRLVGEAQVDRDPARLFLFEPIRIGACQRLDERTLAVIDVTRGSDDDRLRGPASERVVQEACGAQQVPSGQLADLVRVHRRRSSKPQL
jgi:hypothetical protein